MSSQDKIRKTLLATAYNNAVTADLLRRIARQVDANWMTQELEVAARRLDVDADALEAFAADSFPAGVAKPA